MAQLIAEYAHEPHGEPYAARDPFLEGFGSGLTRFDALKTFALSVLSAPKIGYVSLNPVFPTVVWIVHPPAA